jgi:hypothetical protein
MYENFAKVIVQNCTETNFVSFLQLNMNFNPIFNNFVNKLYYEGNFFRDSPFKETVSQDFLLWFFIKQLFYCSEMALTGNPSSKVCVAPLQGREAGDGLIDLRVNRSIKLL